MVCRKWMAISWAERRDRKERVVERRRVTGAGQSAPVRNLLVCANVVVSEPYIFRSQNAIRFSCVGRNR